MSRARVRCRSAAIVGIALSVGDFLREMFKDPMPPLTKLEHTYAREGRQRRMLAYSWLAAGAFLWGVYGAIAVSSSTSCSRTAPQLYRLSLLLTMAFAGEQPQPCAPSPAASSDRFPYVTTPNPASAYLPAAAPPADAERACPLTDVVLTGGRLLRAAVVCVGLVVLMGVGIDYCCSGKLRIAVVFER